MNIILTKGQYISKILNESSLLINQKRCDCNKKQKKTQTVPLLRNDLCEKVSCDIADKNRGKTVVIVSHGCALRNYLSFAEFGSPDGLSEVGWSDNTAVSLIEYDDDLAPTIIYKNDSSHLPHELSTLAFSRWSKYDEKK